MKLQKKMIAGMLSAVMLVSLLAGCGSGKTAEVKNSTSNVAAKSAVKDTNLNAIGTFPIVKEPITLKFVGARDAAHGEWQDMLVLKEYEKLTNIKITYETYPTNGYQERRNIMLASNEIPDAFFRAVLQPNDEVNWGEQGVFIDLNGLLENNAPNLKKMFSQEPALKSGITTPTGKVFTLPQITDSLMNSIGHKNYINKKWLDKLGLKIPTTTDEFITVLKAFRDNDPNGNGKNDELPLASTKPDATGMSFSVWSVLKGSWGLGNRGNLNYDLDEKTGKVRFAFANPMTKEVFAYLNMMYKEKLLDNECFSTDTAAFTARLSNNLVGAQFQSHATGAGKFTEDFAAFPILKGPFGDHVVSYVAPKVQVTGTFAITRNNKYPEATMRWVDYFYGKEGAQLMRLGVEGKTFNKDANGNIQYTDNINKNPNGLTFGQAVGQFSPWPGGGLPYLIPKEYDSITNITKSSFDAVKLLEPDVPKELWPKFYFTVDEQDKLNNYEKDVHKYAGEMMVKFIVGVEPISNFDNYIATMKKMGLDEMLKIVESSYGRYKNSK